MSTNPRSSSLIRAIVGILIAAACLAPLTVSAAAPPGKGRVLGQVGQIFIVGNSRTREDVILEQVALYTGQAVTASDLKRAEKKLARLGIFATFPNAGVRPTVKALENPLDPDNPIKDILISVQETNTSSLTFGVGVSPRGRLSGSIVIQERNLDLLRMPTSLEDLLSGNAFRGAGQLLRLEVFPTELSARITCLPCSVSVALPLVSVPCLLWGRAF
jgi:hypothetical protein